MLSDLTSAANGSFDELGKIVLGDQPLDQLLERVIHIANEMLPGRTEASVTLLAGEAPSTIAFTSELAVALDERQYALEGGPCLHAAQAGTTVIITDMSSEQRWPKFAADAIDLDVRSSLAVPLPTERHVTGALNFYSASPGAFDEQTVELAETFAAHAAVAVVNAHLFESTATLATQMREAMASRAVIEQAKGIIMRDRHCGSDEAFEALVKLSQETHLKLRDISIRLVEQVGGEAVDVDADASNVGDIGARGAITL